MNIKTLKNSGISWVNIEQPSRADMDWLRNEYDFHPLALDDCLSRLQIPKVDGTSGHAEIDQAELSMILEGIDLRSDVRRKRYSRRPKQKAYA